MNWKLYMVGNTALFGAGRNFLVLAQTEEQAREQVGSHVSLVEATVEDIIRLRGHGESDRVFIAI